MVVNQKEKKKERGRREKGEGRNKKFLFAGK